MKETRRNERGQASGYKQERRRCGRRRDSFMFTVHVVEGKSKGNFVMIFGRHKYTQKLFYQGESLPFMVSVHC